MSRYELIPTENVVCDGCGGTIEDGVRRESQPRRCLNSAMIVAECVPVKVDGLPFAFDPMDLCTTCAETVGDAITAALIECKAKADADAKF